MSEPRPATAAAPPAVAAGPRADGRALFSPAQIGVASVLATPVTGALLAAANLHALGRRGGPLVMAAAAVVVSAVFAAAVAGFDVGPAAVFVWGAASWLLAARAFGADVGRAPRRSSGVVAVAIAGVLAVLALVNAGAHALGIGAVGAAEIVDDAVILPTGEGVRFTGRARRDDAADVADALVRAGVLGQPRTREDVLQLTVNRDEHDELVISVLVPADEASRGVVVRGAQRMVAALVAHLTPPRCVTGRLVTPGGVELARGRTCPR